MTDLGGLGAIMDEIVVRVIVARPVANLDFLNEHGVRVEF